MDDAVIEAHLHQAQPTSLAMLLRATSGSHGGVAPDAWPSSSATLGARPRTRSQPRERASLPAPQRRGRKRRAASKGQYRGDTWPTAASAGEVRLTRSSCGSPPFARRTALTVDQRQRMEPPPTRLPVEGGSKSYRVAQLPGFLLASLRPYRPSVFRRRLATLGVRFAHLGTWGSSGQGPDVGPERRSSGPNGV